MKKRGDLVGVTLLLTASAVGAVAASMGGCSAGSEDGGSGRAGDGGFPAADREADAGAVQAYIVLQAIPRETGDAWLGTTSIVTRPPPDDGCYRSERGCLVCKDPTAHNGAGDIGRPNVAERGCTLCWNDDYLPHDGPSAGTITWTVGATEIGKEGGAPAPTTLTFVAKPDPDLLNTYGQPFATSNPILDWGVVHLQVDGAEVPAFSADYRLPTTMRWSTPQPSFDSPSSQVGMVVVSRTEDTRLAWQGGSEDVVVLLEGTGVSAQGNSASISCLLPSAPGSGVFPGSIASQLEEMSVHPRAFVKDVRRLGEAVVVSGVTYEVLADTTETRVVQLIIGP